MKSYMGLFKPKKDEFEDKLEDFEGLDEEITELVNQISESGKFLAKEHGKVNDKELEELMEDLEGEE